MPLEAFKNRSKKKPKNNTKNHRFWLLKWSQNEAKIKGKTLFPASRAHPKPLSKYSFDFLSFLELFCLHLGSLWPPFWLPLADFGLPFGTLWLPLGSLGAVCGPPKDLIASGGEISPRSCRDSAENVPRTLQESAENPPYEPQARSPWGSRPNDPRINPK